MIQNADFCYVGTTACGCMVAACVDSPELKKDVARFVKECVEDGLTVSRIPTEEVRGKLKRCKCAEQKQKIENPELF